MKFRKWLPLVLALGLLPATAAFFTPPEPGETVDTPKVESKELLGLWQATRPEKEGDLLRFYYFHDGGIGLVRYGRMGLTYTRSFTWKLHDGRLAIVFTKSGRHHHVPFELTDEGGVLRLPKDPAFPGDNRYAKDTRPRGLEFSEGKHPLARLWIEETQDVRGQRGFRMYQLQAPTIDGRGVGWYHEGDMSDWSTETLTYRRTGDTMELYFPLRNERITTKIRLVGEGRERSLTLTEDPRNYWHERTYRDGGPGFTVALDGLPIPYAIPGHGPRSPLGAGKTKAAGFEGCSFH